MRKIVFCLFLLVFIPILSFTDESIPQKITLSLDPKNVFYSIDVLIQKAVLSETMGNKKIIVLSSDTNDLKIIGIKQINAGLLLKTKRTGDSYTVEMFSIDAATNLIDNSIQFKANKLASSIGTTARAILEMFLIKFPPRPVQELKTIEVVNVGVSEFETLEPSFKIMVMPAFCIAEYKLEMQTSNGTGYSTSGFDTTPVLFSPAAELLFQYHNINARLGLGYAFGKDGNQNCDVFFINTMGGIGILQSLIVLGIDTYITFGKSGTDRQLSTNSSSSQNIFSPALSYFGFSAGPFLRFNFTKDYYIDISFGIPLFFLDNIKLGSRDLALQSLQVPVDNNDGPPYIKILFNWRVWNQFHLVLSYAMFSMGHRASFNDPNLPKPIAINEQQGIFIQNVSISQYQLGLGIMYEL